MKPEVVYNSKNAFIEIGCSAYVSTYNHPNCSNYEDNVVRTSKVLTYDKETGRFETLNTVYVPMK